MTNEKLHSTILWLSAENQNFEGKRAFMEFPGYWVYVDFGKVVLERTVFDETELDPATNWKQAWQNQDSEARRKGYVELDAALTFAAQVLAAVEVRSMSQSERELVSRFDPT